MAFDTKGLMREPGGAYVGAGAGRQVGRFRYATEDPASVVEASGYFNPAADQFAIGDVIEACLDLAGTPAGKHYIVTAATATTVTISAFA